MSVDYTVRNVIFDLGGVVLRWNVDDILCMFYSDPALRVVAKQEIFKHPDWLDLDRGTLSEEHAIRRFHLRTRRPMAELQALLQAVKDFLVPLPDTVELLHELARAKVPLYCLSNMPATFFTHLRERYSFFELFQGMVISSEVNLIKPDPLIFEHIARHYRLLPDQTVFIDDMMANTTSAAKLGFRTVHFVNAQQCRRDLNHAGIRSLSCV